MNWLESIIYSLISGFTEFLPISSAAHQAILSKLFGQSDGVAALNFTTHLGALAAVYIHCQSHLAVLSRTNKLLSIPRNRRKRQPSRELSAVLKLFRSASTISVIMVILAVVLSGLHKKLNFISIFLLLNGLALFGTGRIATGNKSAVSMTRFDSLLLGLLSGLGAIPGFSRIGLGISATVCRGASTQNALSWSLLISIPTLLALCVADIIIIFTAGVSGFGFVMLLQCLLGAIISYIGATLAISTLRFLAVKVGFSWFSYYNWGLALFAFLLYMI